MADRPDYIDPVPDDEPLLAVAIRFLVKMIPLTDDDIPDVNDRWILMTLM
ncbi:Uncharacterised protein [Leclercia adecarboxylata]|uniref:Uncharacterized protein n=1 Tax=Leclercia adecarboxylata TaxID=83655 RepID=A0A4U9HW89_9ENTR|nr:Uncharacterised protein [Leclercia adecarboxylata]